MIDLNGKIRIIELDSYNTTFEVYKEVESLKTKEKSIKWVREGGYYANLQQCLKGIKDYIIKSENSKNENLDIIKLLEEINNLYIDTIIKIKE